MNLLVVPSIFSPKISDLFFANHFANHSVLFPKNFRKRYFYNRSALFPFFEIDKTQNFMGGF